MEENEQRLESLLLLIRQKGMSSQQLLDFALSEIISLTKSKIGYIYLYNEQSKIFTLNTWSKEIMNECRVKDPETIYQLEKTGIWGEVVRQKTTIMSNDFEAPNSLKKGVPEGHVKLHRFLSIPVVSDEKIVAVAAVANKESDYDHSDERQLTLYMDSVWKIVEQKKTELDLINALKENAALFRELNHRVKNNLSMIISLINLELSKESVGRSSLENISNRIRTISILYDQLSSSTNEDKIDLNDYLNNILNYIEIYHSNDIKLHKNLEQNIYIHSRQATSVGIILNELIMNSIKHAFSFNTKGNIIVNVYIADSDIVLEVIDDGRPLTENFEKSSSIGLVLIKALTEQIQGTLLITREPKSFKITFPKI